MSDMQFRLRSLVRQNASRILYADHIEGQGEQLFSLACALDLVGIVAKHRFGLYLSDGGETTWLKIRNRGCSQMFGRSELFERMADRQQRATEGWARCVLACAEANF